MKQSSTFVYVCPVSGQCVRFQYEDGALWTHANDTIRLFGKKHTQFMRTLKYLLLSREINETADVVETTGKSVSDEIRLNHRAVISLGYHLNFGRVSPLRDWCFAKLQLQTEVDSDELQRTSSMCEAQYDCRHPVQRPTSQVRVKNAVVRHPA